MASIPIRLDQAANRITSSLDVDAANDLLALSKAANGHVLYPLTPDMLAAVLARCYGVKSFDDYGADPTGSSDSRAAIQSCLDEKGLIIASAGSYLCNGPLKFYEDTKIVGVHRGSNGGTNIRFNYSGSEYPVQIMGSNTTNGTWVYNLDIGNLYFTGELWTGSATHFMNISGAYSCSLDKANIDGLAAGSKAVRISKVNALVLDQPRFIGAIGGELLIGIDVLDTDGDVNDIVFRTADVELCTTGIKFSGNTNKITAHGSVYMEECTTYVNWDAGANGSCLTLMGGKVKQRASSTGVLINRSNCSVIGTSIEGGGTYAVDIDGATTHANCHVIGGGISGVVRDTNSRLATNSTLYNIGSLSGTATFSAATTCAVSFSYTRPNANYKIALAPQDNKTYWITSKSTTGFTINASGSTSASIDWMLRQ